MRRTERFCIAWSLAATAFSLGCVMRGDVGGQAEALFHTACVGAHLIAITVTIGLYSRRNQKTSTGNAP